MSCHLHQKYFNFEGCCNNKIRYFKTLFVGVGTKITAFGFEPFSLAFILVIWSNLSYSRCLWHRESAVTALSIITFLLKRFRQHVYLYIYENLGKTKVWASLSSPWSNFVLMIFGKSANSKYIQICFTCNAAII